MSEVYIKEPATNGSVVLHTTLGDLEIELWATECPKACRNFCQLILEGYYNGCDFHRVIRDFIIQTGDKTNTGDGSESIYGEPYPDEIHPRLKFRYRGMLGIASAGAGTKTNGSQFFICMDRAPSLDRKHTLFAKITGQTIYNLVRINEVEVDKHDRPVDAPKIIRAELTWDPFGDLEPRFVPAAPVQATGKEKHRREAIKNKKVLSFGADEEEEDSDDDTKEAASKFGKARSAHDVLSDPKLLKDPNASSRQESKKRSGADEEEASKKRAKPKEDKHSEPASRSRDPEAAAAPPAKAVRRKVDLSESESEKASAKEDEKSESDAEDSSSGEEVQDKSQKRNSEIEKLKRDIVRTRAGEEEAPKEIKKKSAWEQLLSNFKTRGQARDLSKKKNKRERMDEVVGVVKDMKSFKGRVRDVAEDKAELEALAPEVKAVKEAAEEGTLAKVWEEGDEDSTTDWLSGGGLTFKAKNDNDYKNASKKDKEKLEIFDPLAAMGKAELLEEDRKRRSDQLKPSLRRKVETLVRMPGSEGRW